MRTPNYKRILIILSGVLLYFMLITSMLHFERGVTGATIKHFHEAIWYSIVTLITRGYGELFPVSVGGRIIGSFFSLLGISLYILVIATFFAFVCRRIRHKLNHIRL